MPRASACEFDRSGAYERSVRRHVATRKRRGSLPNRWSHSRPLRCIHPGARCFVPAWKSNAAPTPSTSEGARAARRDIQSSCFGAPSAHQTTVVRRGQHEGSPHHLLAPPRCGGRHDLGSREPTSQADRKSSTTASVEPNRAWRRPDSVPDQDRGMRSGPPIRSARCPQPGAGTTRQVRRRENCPGILQRLLNWAVSRRDEDVHVAEHPVSAGARQRASDHRVRGTRQSPMTHSTPSTLRVGASRSRPSGRCGRAPGACGRSA